MNIQDGTWILVLYSFSGYKTGVRYGGGGSYLRVAMITESF